MKPVHSLVVCVLPPPLSRLHSPHLTPETYKIRKILGSFVLLSQQTMEHWGVINTNTLGHEDPRTNWVQFTADIGTNLKAVLFLPYPRMGEAWHKKPWWALKAQSNKRRSKDLGEGACTLQQGFLHFMNITALFTLQQKKSICRWTKQAKCTIDPLHIFLDAQLKVLFKQAGKQNHNLNQPMRQRGFTFCDAVRQELLASLDPPLHRRSSFVPQLTQKNPQFNSMVNGVVLS